MAYQPIANYGIIGDMRTCALVGKDGSIDWLCLPRFDSPSVLSALLDDTKGGRFSISLDDDDYSSRQFYWPDTNVLVTRMLGSRGSIELIDFMPVPGAGGDEEVRQVIRRVRCVRGEARVKVRCEPAFDYARSDHEAVSVDDGVIFRGDGFTLGLGSTHALDVTGGAAHARMTLAQGEEVTFVLRHGPRLDESDCLVHLPGDSAEELFRSTVQFWRRWIDQTTYAGRWQEMVRRSLLVLKLMIYEPTGAIIASPTCGLPETIGGERNWDYRFMWVRDASFTVYALLRFGFRAEAASFVGFLEDVCQKPGEGAPLSVLYTLDGKPGSEEHILDHLEGYRGSRPVRIGNGAADQLQLDIFGELLDAAYLFNKWGEPISYDFWQSLRRFVDWVCDNWDQPDEGVWEVRGRRRHFTYSKLMCWVAVDRAIRLSRKRSLPAPLGRWIEARDVIYREVMERGWSEALGAFRMHYDGEELDAANLIMPLVFFLGPTDPRMLSTLDATLRSPARGGLTVDSLVYRYMNEKEVDGLEGIEGTFNMCTFWLIEAQTRAGRFDRHRLEDARIMFERMLSFANHVGLYSEETSVKGEALGNFPQAFTHLSLVSAAFNLDRALGNRNAEESRPALGDRL